MADPRLDPKPQTANERLQDQSIKHLLWLTRHQNHEARQIIDYLDTEIVPDLIAKLEKRISDIHERGYDRGPDTTLRLKQMAADISQIVGTFRNGMGERLQKDLFELAQHEASHEQQSINNAVPISVDTVLPSAAILRQAVFNRPMDGSPLSDWMDTLSQRAQDGINAAINRGLVEGETVDQIVRRIRGTRANGYKDGVIQALRRNAEAITRTGVIHASTQARETVYEANQDIIKGVMIVVTLDTRTCAECAGYDGHVYDVGVGPRPAFHVSCRCTTTPVLKSWRSMGINADEIDSGSRASMNGQVPASMTYPQWLAKQPRDIVEEALGPTKAKLYLKGGLKVEQFTNRQGRILSLEQLRAKDASAFKRAGLD